MQIPAFKAQNYLFEAILSLIVGIEEDFRKYCPLTVPLICENMNSYNWNVRKICLDIIYTLAILMPEELGPYYKKLLDALNICKFDKVKHVRDAS